MMDSAEAGEVLKKHRGIANSSFVRTGDGDRPCHRQSRQARYDIEPAEFEADLSPARAWPSQGEGWLRAQTQAQPVPANPPAGIAPRRAVMSMIHSRFGS